MAEQNPNPKPWRKGQGDGCTGVPDKLPFIGSMSHCCDEHDEWYHIGGKWADKMRADRKFRRCLKRKGCLFCKMVAWWRFKAVRKLGKKAFNWEGPGPVEMARRYPDYY